MAGRRKRARVYSHLLLARCRKLLERLAWWTEYTRGSNVQFNGVVVHGNQQGELDVQAMGAEIFDQILRHASGVPTKREALALGDHEFVPWHLGVVS